MVVRAKSLPSSTVVTLSCSLKVNMVKLDDDVYGEIVVRALTGANVAKKIPITTVICLLLS